MAELEAAKPFDADEGDVVALVDVLLGHRRSARSARFGQVKEVKPQLLRALCERVARAAVRLLYAEGGARKRSVLRGGERVHARIFDAERADAVRLEFSEATERFLTQLATHAHFFFAISPERLGKRFAREILPMEQGTRSGDWVFFALVDENLDRVHIDSAATRAVSERIRALSPLAALRAPHLASGTEPRTLYSPLVTPQAIALVESTPDWLERAWEDALIRGLRAHRDHEGFVAHFENTSGALRAWLALLDEAQRLDLALPLARAVAAFGRELLARDDPRLYVRERAHAASVSEGDRALRAVSGCLGVIDQLSLLRDLMGAQRYGDARYEEAQVFLGDYDTHIAHQALDLIDLGRVLEGRIG
jgi:hypothetical protein